jgi:hypothetical protein
MITDDMLHENLARAFERLPPAGTDRRRRLGAFLVGIAGALAAGTALGVLGRRRARTRGREAAMDDALDATFPASDAVAHGEGATPGPPSPRERP